MIRSAVFAALLLALSLMPAHGAEAPIGLFTIVEGDVVVLRDAREFNAAEGLALQREDIVRSRAGSRLSRIELDDGTLLDLGPATELLLQPHALGAAGDPAATLYLLRGWLKVSAAPAAPGAAAKTAPAAMLVAPQLGIARLSGSVVVHAMPQATLTFVEAGHADVLERSAAKAGAMHALNDGDSFVVRANAPAAQPHRPPADLIDGLPGAFADTLPRRAAQWRGRGTEPGPAHDPAYADLAPWLQAEPTLRMPFAKRFSSLAREPAFRTALLADLRALPEWGRVLFPEKYRPKTTIAHRRTGPTPIAAKTKAVPPTAAASAAPATTPSTESALAQAPKTETP